jgi:uncharacterized protein YihD (DUF1040 family)
VGALLAHLLHYNRSMRDPKRIGPILETLRLAWERSPDLRLGQLIVIIASIANAKCDVFYVEDDTMVAGLDKWNTDPR